MRRKVLTSLSTALSFAKGRGLVAQNVARELRSGQTIGTGLTACFSTKEELRLLNRPSIGTLAAVHRYCDLYRYAGQRVTRAPLV